MSGTRRAIAAQALNPQKWEVALMARLINVAEVQYKATHGVYVDFATLVRSGQLRETDEHAFTVMPGNFGRRSTDPIADPLPGYALRMVMSANGESYNVSIREKTTGPCAYLLSTSETGILIEASETGCVASVGK